MNKCISLAKFLAVYYCFEGEGLKTLKHEDIKKHFPYICVCEDEDNLDKLIDSGKILLVDDGKKILPYYLKNLNDTKYDIYLKKQKNINQSNCIKDFTEMNNFELLQLLNIRFNKRSISNKARKELNNRGKVLKRTYKVKRDNEIFKSKIIEEEL